MMPEPQKYIVGRQSEVEQFAALLDGRTKHWLLNIYGPGGIGKTVVGTRMLDYAQEQGVPAVFVDGIDTSLTPDRIMHAVQDGFVQAEPLEHSFSAFEKAYDEYLIVQEVLQRGGGVQAMFDVVGNVEEFVNDLGGGEDVVLIAPNSVF
jgi:Cdc6-like AAA superfamily ATPase